jgi:hypothetical protein
MSDSPDPEQYVKENKRELTRIVKHSSTTFPRALALAALVEYGDDPDAESLIEELEKMAKSEDSQR